MFSLLESIKISKREREPAPPQDLQPSSKPSSFRLTKLAGRRQQDPPDELIPSKSASRSFGASGSLVLSSQHSNENPGLSHDYAVSFMELVPVPMCTLDLNGNIRHMNLSFKSQMNLYPSSGPSSKMKCITSIVEIICLSDTDRFYSHVTKLTSNSINILQGEFLTKTRRMKKIGSQPYNWTLAMSSDRTFILATARAATERDFSVREADDDDNILDAAEEKPLPEGFVASEKWQKFMDRVEENARKMVELKESQLKAQALAETLETKRIFVRHVSHEIRTPLNVVMSGLELMESFKNVLSSELMEILGDIKNACGVAIDILNDLLTYEKLDSNILTLEKSPCDFVDLVRRVCSMFQIQARYSNINLAFDCRIKDGKITVDADSTKLAQVIRNLVSNALKFTPDGGMITVKMLTVAGGRSVRLEVQDTGPGMTREQRKKLFNEVVQFNPKELQNGQGSGLGLFLSRKIVDMHRGNIGVEVEWEGKGSIFFLELGVCGDTTPQQSWTCHDDATKESWKASEPQQAKIDASIIAALRILIVDDAALVRKYHRRLLAPSCEEILEASNGQDAVDKVRESIDQGVRIDGILMDSSMPFMDGTTATKLIRDLGYKGKIFGITGNAFQSDINEFTAHGVDEVLIKPLSMDQYAYAVRKMQGSCP